MISRRLEIWIYRNESVISEKQTHDGKCSNRPLQQLMFTCCLNVEMVLSVHKVWRFCDVVETPWCFLPCGALPCAPYQPWNSQLEHEIYSDFADILIDKRPHAYRPIRHKVLPSAARCRNPMSCLRQTLARVRCLVPTQRTSSSQINKLRHGGGGMIRATRSVSSMTILRHPRQRISAVEESTSVDVRCQSGDSRDNSNPTIRWTT